MGKNLAIIIFSCALIALTISATSEIFDIVIEQPPDGNGLVKIRYCAKNTVDSTLAVNVQTRWAGSLTWHIPMVTLFDTVSAYYETPNFGWRAGADSVGVYHCFIWDMTTDLGPVEDSGFVARIVTFDSLVSTFNVIDSFSVSDSTRPDMRAFGLAYKHGRLWVLYHNESTHDCWIRPYSLTEFTVGDSIYIGTVTIGPSDMAFAGDRLFWVEDTRLLLKEFDFSTGTSSTVRGDWWSLPGTSMHIAGCAFDGENLWVCFSAGTFISLDTSDFSLVDTMFFPEFGISTPATSADGLAWGLGLLWCYSNDNTAYAIDVEMDSIIHRVPTGDVVLETGAEGAAWDGMNLWVVDYARGYVYKLLLYSQIMVYLSDPFRLDNKPPRLDWISPSAPDFSDTFVAEDTVEILWSVEDANISGGSSHVLLDSDTILALSSVETSFLWRTNPWPGYHGSFDLFVSDSFGNVATENSPEFVIGNYEGVGESRLPEEQSLNVFPNPFNSACRITVEQTFLSVQNGQTGMSDLPTVEIFDINGRMVAEIPVNNPDPSANGRGDRAPTNETVIWTPDKSIGSGIYLVRARFSGESIAKRIVYLK